MGTKKHINELLNRKMDRKDFLKHLGVGTAAIFGLGTAMKAITSMNNQGQKVQQAASGSRTATSYGGGPYGGRRVS